MEIHNVVKQTMAVKLPLFGRAGVGVRLVGSVASKGGFLACEKPPFASQKVAYWETTDNQLITDLP